MTDDLCFSIKPNRRLIDGDRSTSADTTVSYDVNLRALRDGYRGRTDSDPFLGAPMLASAICPILKNLLEGGSQYTARGYQRSLFCFFRFLSAEGIADGKMIRWDTLVLYQNFLNAQLEKPDHNTEIPRHYSNIALLAGKLSPGMDIPKNPFSIEKLVPNGSAKSRKIMHSEADRLVEKSRRIVLAAFSEVERIVARFEAGKAMAACGMDPRLLLPPTQASGSPRSVIAVAYSLANTLYLLKNDHQFEPTAASEFEHLYGVRPDYLDYGCDARGESWNTGMSIIQNWVIPSRTDLVAPFMFCNEFLGWNASVMLSLRSSTVSAALANLVEGQAEIWAPKGRGSEMQRRPVISVPPFGPLDVLASVNEWTAPLRSKLRRELDELRAAKIHDNHADDKMIDRRIEWLERNVDRLWLAFNRRKTGKVVALELNDICSRQFGALLISQNVFGERYTTGLARSEFAKRAEASGDFQGGLVTYLMQHASRTTTDRDYLAHGRAIEEVAVANAALVAEGRARLTASREISP